MPTIAPKWGLPQTLTVVITTAGIIWGIIWWNMQDSTTRMRQLEHDNTIQEYAIKEVEKRTNELTQVVNNLKDNFLELRTTLNAQRPFAEEDRQRLAKLVEGMTKALELVRDLNDVVQKVSKDQIAIGARLDDAITQKRIRK